MRTPIVVAVVAILAVGAGGAYYGLEVYPQQQFRSSIDQALTALPPGTTVTYKDAHYAPVTSQATLTGVTVHGTIPGDTPLPFDLTIDSIETTNANLDFANAWAKAAANPASSAQGAALAVADVIAVKGVTFHSGVLTAAEDSARITKLRLYPWALLHDGMPSWKEIQALLAHKSDPPDLTALRPMLRAEAAVVLGLAYDSYVAEGMKGSETLPDIRIDYTVREATGSGFDRGVLAKGSAEGITATGAKFGTFSADRVTIGESDFREPMTGIINGELLSPALLNGIKIGRIEYSGINVQPPGMPATRIGGISAGPIAFAQGMPITGQFGWTDFTVSRAQMPDRQAQEAFDKLGLQTMTVSFAAAYNWDVARQTASVHDTMLKINELGTLTVSADLASMAPNLAGLAQARLAHAKLRFDDASLTDRLLRMGAAMSGSNPDAFRQQIAGMVLAQSAAIGAGSPVLLAAAKSAGAFLTSPKSLTVELSPRAPIALLSLQNDAADPAALATAIGLSVTANQP
jgi:hypothetical protein